MVEVIDLGRFFEMRNEMIPVDVRSPIEFEKGHIPQSVNIPLFSNDERAEIGWTYKHKGQEEAIKLGESIGEPKIPDYLEQAEIISKDKKILILCSRGGLRSFKFSRLLDEQGYQVYRLDHGYKSYRRHVLASFRDKLSLIILGGKTGSGKTELLKALAENREQVLDLEALAHHRGSAFGSLGMESQPASEHFENCLFEEIRNFTPGKRIWVEDESQNIGRVFLPLDFYNLMKKSPLVLVEMDRERRIARLCSEYGKVGREALERSIGTIQKRLGSENYKRALDALNKDDLPETASIILYYYDKCYEYGMAVKKRILLAHVFIEDDSLERTADKILSQLN